MAANGSLGFGVVEVPISADHRSYFTDTAQILDPKPANSFQDCTTRGGYSKPSVVWMLHEPLNVWERHERSA